MEDWVTLFTTLGVRDGLTPEAARSRAHALVWTARGLAVQAITTGERQAAFDEFRRVVHYLSGIPGDTRPRPVTMATDDLMSRALAALGDDGARGRGSTPSRTWPGPPSR